MLFKNQFLTKFEEVIAIKLIFFIFHLKFLPYNKILINRDNIAISVFVHFWLSLTNTWQISEAKIQTTLLDTEARCLVKLNVFSYHWIAKGKQRRTSKHLWPGECPEDTHDQPRGALKCTEKVDSSATLQSTNSTVEIYVLIRAEKSDFWRQFKVI